MKFSKIVAKLFQVCGGQRNLEEEGDFILTAELLDCPLEVGQDRLDGGPGVVGVDVVRIRFAPILPALSGY